MLMGMLRTLRSCLLVLSAFAVTASLAQSNHDKGLRHAAKHAEHWVKHHTNPPTHRHHLKRGQKDRSVHHAAIHGEHWLKHHISAPHKKKH